MWSVAPLLLLLVVLFCDGPLSLSVTSCTGVGLLLVLLSLMLLPSARRTSNGLFASDTTSGVGDIGDLGRADVLFGVCQVLMQCRQLVYRRRLPASESPLNICSLQLVVAMACIEVIPGCLADCLVLVYPEERYRRTSVGEVQNRILLSLLVDVVCLCIGIEQLVKTIEIRQIIELLKCFN